jgi:hypothetical protein
MKSQPDGRTNVGIRELDWARVVLDNGLTTNAPYIGRRLRSFDCRAGIRPTNPKLGSF